APFPGTAIVLIHPATPLAGRTLQILEWVMSPVAESTREFMLAIMICMIKPRTETGFILIAFAMEIIISYLKQILITGFLKAMISTTGQQFLLLLFTSCRFR